MTIERQTQTFEIDAKGLELRLTAAPVAWGKGRWPATDWINGELLWCLRDHHGACLVRARQSSPDRLSVSGFDRRDDAETWLTKCLGWGQVQPGFDEPVVAQWLASQSGLRPYANGSLAEGVLFSIIGQSITVQAAAVTERRVSAMFTQPLTVDGREFYPFPLLEDLADATAARIRESGVTWRRAEAIVAIAKIACDGGLISDDDAMADPDAAHKALRALPLVGPWTAASAMLWGLGAADAHPTGDVALLRAAKAAYDRPDMTLKDLDNLAEAWRPSRGWAARSLWLSLLGPAN
ncbi:MAG: DNA-3-methyladenine glycosylase family protein [Thermomicrobiales bacterium]